MYKYVINRGLNMEAGIKDREVVAQKVKTGGDFIEFLDNHGAQVFIMRADQVVTIEQTETEG